MSSPGRRPTVDRWLLVVAGVICAVLIAGYVDALVSAGSTNGRRFGSLVDHHGRIFGDQAASRGFKLVAFGYTQCPDVCPTTLLKAHLVLNALGPTVNQVTPLFITLDPVHDTPRALELYTSNFDARIVGITGEAREVRAFASTYGVYPPGEEPTGMREVISHSAMLYLLGRDNELLAAYQPVVRPESIASDIARRRPSNGGHD
jgi:cytochrome oxidase Cu insertion factor (SCO1/SenC/PrrC family)